MLCLFVAVFSLSTLLVFVVDAVAVVIPHLLFRNWKTRTRLVSDAREEKLGSTREKIDDERSHRKEKRTAETTTTRKEVIQCRLVSKLATFVFTNFTTVHVALIVKN